MSARPIGTLGRYTLLKEIGHGGMAKVFLARRTGSADPCVLKQLHVDLEQNPTASKRFQREANIVSRLHHPNIANVLGAGMEGSTFCIAMELIAGQTVEAMMVELWQREATIPTTITIAVVLGVLDAAAYAHALADQDGTPVNIVHRDLSPRNIMVSFDGAIKVIDFGVAHGRIDGFQTAPGMMVGTLRYMSPEQAMAEKIDRRSDIYTLGIVLYEMLTGQPGITDTKAVDVLNRVISEPLPLLRSKSRNLPAALEAVIVRATQKDRTDRYQTAAEFRDALVAATASIGRADHAEIGGLLRDLFPDHVREVQTWIEDARGLEMGDDALEHPTLSEVLQPDDQTPVPMVRTPSRALPRAPSLSMRDVPTVETKAAIDPSDRTLDDVTMPPPPPAVERGASRDTGGIRLRSAEEQMRRWRSAALILLVALTGAITTLTWMIVRSQ